VQTIVTTRQGKLQGALSDGVYAFKGIPYAAAPFGAYRFLPPQPVEPWAGVRDALDYGPTPPQASYPPPFDAIFPERVASGEDCLNLNVWSPELGAGGRPVMVWIVGGAFEHAMSAPYYDGSRFARDGIVCVSINYRVGADGFLYLGDGTANCGLLDQIAALQWVQANIAAFGGDPGAVTVFGESAGAISIAMLLAMPRAQGLFRRAICQSGAAHPTLAAAAAQRVGQRLAERLGVAATREAIAAVPIARALQAQAELSADLAATRDPQRWGEEVVVSMMPWQPVIDGDVIPARPLDRIAAGAGADIDLMVGSNIDEWRLFLVPNGMIAQITEAMAAGAVAAYGLPAEAALALYRAALPNASAGDLLAAIQGDWYFRIPAMRLADAHAKAAKRSSTYVYEFAWRSPQFNGALGACHGLEVPFVFDTLGAGTELLLGASPPQQLADVMHAAWVAFASNGECRWPKYEPERRAAMRFDTRSEIVENPRSAIRALWEERVEPVGVT
jgi:para-nitrobenzyl esterase